MNMFARFDENPAMTLQDIKKTKRYGRTDRRMDAHTDARTTWKQYTHHKQSLRGYKERYISYTYNKHDHQGILLLYSKVREDVSCHYGHVIFVSLH